MKIIAQTIGRYFLMEAEEDEIAKCAGYSYVSVMPQELRPAVGREVKVTEAFAATQEIIASDHQLADAKTKLERTLSAIATMQKILTPKAATIKAKLP